MDYMRFFFTIALVIMTMITGFSLTQMLTMPVLIKAKSLTIAVSINDYLILLFETVVSGMFSLIVFGVGVGNRIIFVTSFVIGVLLNLVVMWQVKKRSLQE